MEHHQSDSKFFQKNQWLVIGIHQLYETRWYRYLPTPDKKTWLGSLVGNFRCGGCRHCDNLVRTINFIDVSSWEVYPLNPLLIAIPYM